MPRFSFSPTGCALRITSPTSSSVGDTAPSSSNDKAWTRYRASDMLDDTDSDDSDSVATTSSEYDSSSDSSEDPDDDVGSSYSDNDTDSSGDDDGGEMRTYSSPLSYGRTRFSPDLPSGRHRRRRSPRTPMNGSSPSLAARDSSGTIDGEEKKEGDDRYEAARLLRSLGRMKSPKPSFYAGASTNTMRGGSGEDGGGGAAYVGSFVRGYNVGCFFAVPSGATGNPSDTAALLAHDRRMRADRSSDALEGGVDRISDLLRAATLVEEKPAVGAPLVTASSATASASIDRLMALAEVARRDTAAIAQRMEMERSRYDFQQRSAADALRSLIKADEEAARKVEERERMIREEAEAMERARAAAEQAEIEKIERARAEREEEERRAQEAAAAKIDDERRVIEKDRAEKEKIEQERQERRKAEQMKKREHVTKAKKLVSKLAEVKASLEPFDKSKEVSRRRLGMKKVVRGKVNTLSHDVEKIRMVAAEVVRAINEQRAIDEETKKAILAGQPIPHENARGKRYFLDMLSDNVIVRVQAEGFNGTRGDGFPLAGMLALVSVEAKDLVPLLAAHVYRACPTAIPTLPEVVEGESETELMESLGMNKDKNGEYETFERFLQRTEGLISIVANIMASGPPNHSGMGGHKAALDWLERFLNLLAPAPHAPLPLVTAPVLVAFLTGAGHMLANKYPDQFRAYMTKIVDDVSKRVDTGTVGQPSATRLKKVLEGGFEGFRTTLPPGAVPECYDGAEGTGQGSTAPLPEAPPPPPPRAPGAAASVPPPAGFGQGGAPQQGGGGGARGRPPCKFFAQGTCRNGANCQFSHEVPGGSSAPAPGAAAAAPSPFGGGVAAVPSPFGGASASGMGAAPSPFGGAQPQPQQPPQQQQQQPQMGSPSPFGGGGVAAASPSPFGGGAVAPASSPFGGGAAVGAAPSPSPFGAAAPPPSPFGGGGAAPAPSPFGATGAAPAPSPFGGGATAPTPTPFGGGAPAAPAPSPFGGGGGAAAPSPFGVGAAASAPSPFGGGGAAPAPSPFGAGGAAPAPSPFGGVAVPAPSPFGGGVAAPAPSPFGGGAAPAPSPFGGGATAPAPTPFGGGGGGAAGGGAGGGSGKPPCRFFAKGQCRNGANCQFSHDMPAGGGGIAQGGGGGGRGKPPCKFFAQGKCRNGANCQFSHEMPGGGGGGAFGGGGTFGGGASTAPSPFGGGGGAMPPAPPFGGAAAPSPFGGGAAPAPSPFGGGGGGGGFGGSPFGGPRR